MICLHAVHVFSGESRVPEDAGRSQVAAAAGQGGRDPQQLACGVRHYPHLHPVAAVLLGEVGSAVADSVALGERAVQQDVLRIGLQDHPQQSRRPARQMTVDSGYVCVGGADG